jgi:hypothetical protein
MANEFFEHPILNSPYEYPSRHWELDEVGQPTQKIIERRRTAKFITPIPKPKKRKAAGQSGFVFDEGKGLSTEEQQYDPNSIINEVRQTVDAWRSLPNPNQWQVTPETARLLQHSPPRCPLVPMPPSPSRRCGDTGSASGLRNGARWRSSIASRRRLAIGIRRLIEITPSLKRPWRSPRRPFSPALRVKGHIEFPLGLLCGGPLRKVLHLFQFVPLKVKRRGVEMRLIINGGDEPRKPDPALLKAFAGAAPEHRSADLRLVVPVLPLDSECDHCGQARDRYPVASARLSFLLALEIPPTWWPPQDRPRDPRPHPTDEKGEPTVGSAAGTRRTADARDRGRRINRGEAHDQEAGTTLSELEHIPAQSCRWDRVHRSVRGSYYLLLKMI